MTLFKPRVGKVIFAKTTGGLCVITLKIKEKDPKLCLGRRRVFFAAWLGDKWVNGLGINFLGVGISLLCLGSSIFGLVSGILELESCLWTLGLY